MTFRMRKLISRWLKRTPAISIRGARSSTAFRPQLESLEGRVLLSTKTWDGGGTNNNWTNAVNWDNNTAPVAGDDLVFTGLVRTTNVNDFPAATTFKSITLQGTPNQTSQGFILSGNSVFVTDTITSSTGGNLVNLPLLLTKNVTANIFGRPVVISTTNAHPAVTVAAGSVLTLDGTISGAGTITKDGPGRLVLTASNTYTGATFIDAGEVLINDGSALGPGSFTSVLTGATLIVAGNISVNERLEMTTPSFGGGSGGGVATLRNQADNNTWTGQVVLSSDTAISVLGTSQLTISGVISNTQAVEASLAVLLRKSDTGRAILSGSNSYTAVTEVVAGSLRVQNSFALGATSFGTTVSAGAALEIEDAAIGGELFGVDVGNEPLTLNGTGLANTGALRSVIGDNSWSGPVTLATNATVGVDLGSQLALTGTVGGAGGLTKVGGGTLILGGNSANTYNGATQAQAGFLLLSKPNNVFGTSASQPVTVSAGASLGGRGKVAGINSTGGLIVPGNIAAASTANLASVGNLVLNGGTMTVKLNGTTLGTNYDAVAVSGARNLGNSTLNVTLGFNSAVGDKFVIIPHQGSDPVQGTFAGLPEGATFTVNGQTFQITYAGVTTAGNTANVVLTHINTPPALKNRTMTPEILEGQIVTVTGNPTEPDSLDPFILDVTWGDGSPTETFEFPAGTEAVSATHRYLHAGAFQIDLKWSDPNGGFNTGSLNTLVRNTNIIVTGSGADALPLVRVLDSDTRAEKLSFLAFDQSFQGGVRVAAGDLDGDGVQDIIAAAGPGGGPHVRAFSGRDYHELASFFAYDATFSSGVFVASGDVNGDGHDDIITGADAGAGPHVKVFSGLDLTLFDSFFAYGPGFAGGVRVAAGDVDGDGHADIITGAGAGGGPHVKVFSGQGGAELASFFAYDAGFTNGVFVAAGDVNGDGHADIITGAGAGGGPHVKAFNGQGQSELASFFAFDASFTGGVFVAATDANGDGRADIVTGAGPGGGPEVRIFDGLADKSIDSFFAYESAFTDGVFVGGR